MKRTIINKEEVADWIREVGTNGVMLTISEPHAKLKYLNLEQAHMEPIVSRIIELASKVVYGKHKRFEALEGLVVCESPIFRPHFHIVFKKPETIDKVKFKDKLTKLAIRLCNKKFRFDLSDSNLPEGLKKVMAFPCYDRFVEVTNTHKNTGSYLTKEHANYYLLTGRKLVLKDSKIELSMKLYGATLSPVL
ncbi:hypothetical protein SAMN05216403_13224 [Nitrosospira multiformis ATCC 25196]|uniref:Uncharacterized protein n=1 Tax=Nitrosospira multiformis (strain ATCC 25196 / NCIMB 11849 / C 71) TaxID=323848 RepID=Q2YCU9_NITMU|nr:hypothetical protein [Nitrosospira multiformis]ABB73422.1 hypothetical protein Nmul_A0113 [Nitrosospira multiformis ATCC 25196]SEG12047.1 hypothetical protein SAMN05216403_13224 [Nitrosospira multiformis ATCC 25196]